MRLIATLSLLAVVAGVFAQDGLRPVRFRIRHADPWLVKAMLEGRQAVSPEIGTIMAMTGAGPFAGAAVNGFFENGTFMVNPTDNSLWFIPNRTPRN